MAALLYGETDREDLIAVLTYLNSFATGLGVDSIDLDLDALGAVVRSMRQDFPHKDGIENASVFKKAAHFLTYFVALKPVRSPFPDTVKVNGMCGLKNHENAAIAFEIAIDALHGATLKRRDQTVVKLANRISVSEHSYIDIVEALTTVTPRDHFKVVAVLLEQLAYRANPDASYALM